jgi:hypothetical protein
MPSFILENENKEHILTEADTFEEACKTVKWDKNKCKVIKIFEAGQKYGTRTKTK